MLSTTLNRLGDWPLPIIGGRLRIAHSPTQGIFRVAVKDTELGGVAIPRGSMINMRFGAANRDEKVFPNADRLDVCRKNAGAHLAFSTAEHH